MRPSKPRRRDGGAILLVCALASLPASAASPAPRRVAISYFDNNSGDREWDPIRKGLADMLITDLASVKSVQIVERDKLGAVIEELKLQRSKLFDPATAVKIGKLAGAEYLLAGAYELSGDTMRIDARLIEVATAKITATSKVTGKKDEFFELEKELVDLLTGKLELPLETSEKARLRKNQTESFEAFRLYARGLDAADRGDRANARSDFQKALEADSKYQAARGALERLNAALETHGKVRAQDFAGLLETLDPASPSFYSDVEKLPERFGGAHMEVRHNRLRLLAWLAEKGYRPWRRSSTGDDFSASDHSYYEANEVLRELGSWHGQLELLPDGVVTLEYLHDKYPDGYRLWRAYKEQIRQARLALPEADNPPPRPPGSRSSDEEERVRGRAELLGAIARLHRASLGRKSAAPRDVLDRLEAALDEERRRAHVAFDQEFRKRLAALDAKDERVGFPLDDLASAARQHFERFDDAADSFPYEVLTDEWSFDHRVRPYHGTAKNPYYLEEHRLLNLVNRAAGDPDSTELLPPVVEYVLAKYADEPMVASNVRVTTEHLARCRAGREAESCRRDWEREKHEGDHVHAEAARALFRKIGRAVKAGLPGIVPARGAK